MDNILFSRIRFHNEQRQPPNWFGKPVYGIPTFPLTAKDVLSKGQNWNKGSKISVHFDRVEVTVTGQALERLVYIRDRGTLYCLRKSRIDYKIFK